MNPQNCVDKAAVSSPSQRLCDWFSGMISHGTEAHSAGVKNVGGLNWDAKRNVGTESEMLDILYGEDSFLEFKLSPPTLLFDCTLICFHVSSTSTYTLYSMYQHDVQSKPNYSHSDYSNIFVAVKIILISNYFNLHCYIIMTYRLLAEKKPCLSLKQKFDVVMELEKHEHKARLSFLESVA